jgi:hypothetical protein
LLAIILLPHFGHHSPPPDHFLVLSASILVVMKPHNQISLTVIYYQTKYTHLIVPRKHPLFHSLTSKMAQIDTNIHFLSLTHIQRSSSSGSNLIPSLGAPRATATRDEETRKKRPTWRKSRRHATPPLPKPLIPSHTALPASPTATLSYPWLACPSCQRVTVAPPSSTESQRPQRHPPAPPRLPGRHASLGSCASPRPRRPAPAPPAPTTGP